MKLGVKTKKLCIDGMTCVSCQNKIENKLRNTAGVKSARVSYRTKEALVAYDTDILSLHDILAIIRRLGYEVSESGQSGPNGLRTAGMLLIIAALYMLPRQWGFGGIFNAFPTAKAQMGYGMLFVIGLLTSVHCVAMCGGINLSQCIPRAGRYAGSRMDALRPGFLYNFGRIASYTAIGGMVGALGSVVSLSGGLRGAVQLLAGICMVIMGINMLGLFPWLRRLTPRLPGIFARKIDAEKGRSKSPLFVGLLNGLMPCGPLQAMQLYALSTGDPIKGALSMLLFSLGTVPLMFGLGALGSLLSRKFTNKVMTAGAVLVAVLGLSMFSQGWSLSGFAAPSWANAFALAKAAPEEPDIAPEGGAQEEGVQIVSSALSPGRYPAIAVQAGIPVKWVIDAPEGSINGCNNRIFIPEYGIEHTFQPGENIIEFTPAETGTFPYSCWMGMIRSAITVTEEGAGAQTPGEGDSLDIENGQGPMQFPALFEPDGNGSCCQ